MILSLAWLAATWFLISVAQPTVSDVPVLLRKFETTYHASKTMRASFLERYLDNGKEVRSEAGVAYFARPGKMRWEYVSPEVNLYVVDGKWSWFYVPADHTVTRIRAKQSTDARTPLALLAGEMKVSRICNSVDADTAARPSDPAGVVLRCILRASENSSRAAANGQGRDVPVENNYALFELNPVNGELLRVLVAEPGGVQIEFRFTNWEFGPRIEDSMFHFQAPKGVAIVDGDLGVSDASGAKQER
jgi:outer membrane lipoprotein carrier protein